MGADAGLEGIGAGHPGAGIGFGLAGTGGGQPGGRGEAGAIAQDGRLCSPEGDPARDE